MALTETLPNAAARIDWRLGLIAFLAVLALSIPQAALLPLLDRDEPRFAEASREMVQSGNYVVPTFNGAPRYAKPPLIYWCQTVAYRVFGENAFAARLPSLLATAGTALILVTWGMRLGSAQVGLGAGLSYAFCLQTVQQGRVATADALLIFFMTLTAFIGWKILFPKLPGRVPALCFVTLALGLAGGFLAKGPEALLPLAPLFWCARGAGRAIIAGILASFLAALVLILLWALPAYIETHGDYWRVGMSEGVGERMVTGLQGHGATNFGWYLLSVPLYLVIFWLSALPWSPLLIIHRKKLFTGWQRDLTDDYLLLNAAVIFVVFSLMVTKLPHYTLPAFPFLALAFARRLATARLSPGILTELGWISGAGLALLTLIFVPIAIANHATPSPVGELVREAGDALTPQTEFALVDFQEPNVVWEMRRVVTGYGRAIPSSEMPAFLNQPGPHAVIFSKATLDKSPAIFDGVRGGIKVYHARGFNAAKGSFIGLYLVVKP
jgi:4-amino-4-deoxy-L-arabinose transferase-like glycosyltransferase